MATETQIATSGLEHLPLDDSDIIQNDIDSALHVNDFPSQ